jgi:dUTP pyrophosphatase
MKVQIRTIGDTQVPAYQTSGACGFDCTARETTIIKSKSLGLVPTGLIIKVPEGYALLAGSRSSTPKKYGLLTPHGFGMIDQDYHGDSDELFLQFYNFTGNDVTIQKGERVGQAFFVRCNQAEFVLSKESLKDKSRGGFGSTGH